MHARYFVAWGFVFGLVALLASACVATVDSTAPEEDIGTDAEAQEAFKFVVCKGNQRAANSPENHCTDVRALRATSGVPFVSGRGA
jgi:hypothetical protein